MFHPQAMKVLSVAAPLARTTTANSSGVDLAPYIAASGPSNVKFFLDCGAQSGTTPTLDVVIKESSDNSTFTTVTTQNGTGVFSQLAGATGNQEIHAQITKRYVRAEWTIAGTTPSFTFGVTALVGQRNS